MNEIINQTPPSSQNHERNYWLRFADKFKKSKSGWRARILENRFEDICIDIDDGDFCAESRGEIIN